MTDLPLALLSLSPRLDLTEAQPLARALDLHRGQPLTIDASGVEHLGALCLQLLIAAARQWRADGLEFQIDPRSDAFTTALEMFGLAPAELERNAA